MNSKLLVLCIWHFLFISCIENEIPDGYATIKVKDTNGKIIGEVTYNVDSGYKQNITTSYDENGNVKSVITYYNDKKNGKAYYYQDNLLKRECFYDNDREIDYSLLYQEGKLLQYAFIDKNGSTRYVIDYHRDSSIKKKEGRFFYIMYDNKIVNNKIKLIIHSAIAPKAQTCFTISESNGKKYNFHLKEKSEFVILRDKSLIGTSILITGVIKDSITGLLIDSMNISFNSGSK